MVASSTSPTGPDGFDGREIDEVHGVGTGRHRAAPAPCDADGDACLADAAGTPERHQRLAVEHLDHVVDQRVAVDEVVGIGRQTFELRERRGTGRCRGRRVPSGAMPTA